MDTKYCPGCRTDLPKVDFRPNKDRRDGLQGYCITCDKARQAAYYKRHRARLREERKVAGKKIKKANINRVVEYLKSNPCCDCGEVDPVVLEFDHRDGVDKLADVSALVNGKYSWSKILEEIEKCDVRCANCHRRRTAKQLGWYIMSLI